MNAIARLNTTYSNTNAVANFYAAFAARQSRKVSKFLGRIAQGNVKDVLSEISYTSSALAAVSAGCAPPPSQPFTLWDTEYPELYGCFNASDSSCNTTSVACQANAYIGLSIIQVQTIQLAEEYLLALTSLCNNSTSTNSTSTNSTSNSTASALIQVWANLAVTAQNFTSDGSAGPLMVRGNTTFTVDIALALNLTADYLDQYNNATRDLLSCVDEKSFKIRRGSRGSNGSNGSNGSHGSKARKRFQNWMKLFHKRNRRGRKARAIIAMNTFFAGCSQALNSIVSASNDFITSINGIVTTSFIYVHARAHSLAFGNWANKLKNSYILFAINLNVTSNSIEQVKSDFVLNATDAVNATGSELLAQILAANSSSCSNYTDNVLEAIADFTLNLETCSQAADNATEAAIANATESFRAALQNVSLAMNSTNDCYKNGCAAAFWYPFNSYGVRCGNDPSMKSTCYRSLIFPYSCPSSWANQINSCLNNVSKFESNLNLQIFDSLNSQIVVSINSTIATVDSAIAATESSLSSALSAIISSLQSCIATQMQSTLTVLGGIYANYTACLNSTNTTAV